MDLSVVFLGTGGSVPSARRATACVLIRSGGARILVDCGEGAQRQMINSTGLVQVDDIYITHFHADHYLGLPGLLKTYDLLERRAPLRIAGPPGLHALFEALRRIFGRLRYEVELIELGPGEAVGHEMAALGYAYVEPERPGRFDVDAARGLGITDDRDFGRLQRGETISVDGSEVRPDQVMGDPRPGRKVVITGDTGPCEMTRVAAHAAQLLVHDGGGVGPGGGDRPLDRPRRRQARGGCPGRHAGNRPRLFPLQRFSGSERSARDIPPHVRAA